MDKGFIEREMVRNIAGDRMHVMESDETGDGNTCQPECFLYKTIPKTAERKQDENKQDDGIQYIHKAFRRSLTIRLTTAPSAFPRTLAIIIPITLPISPGEEAPVDFMASSVRTEISSSLIISGR